MKKPAQGFRRLPRIADQMTPTLHRCLASSLAAERAGDATSALEWHRAIPVFERSRHRKVLELLVSLGPQVPEWVWARWIAYQSTRCEDGETNVLNKCALRVATESIHQDRLVACHRDGGDPVKVSARVMGESWVYQQLAVHELDSIGVFIDEHATAQLAEHAELAARWSGAAMGGYEIGESTPGARLRIRDASTDEWLETLDLGARSGAERTRSAPHWVIGRLVPSGVGDLPMFDIAPLTVTQQLATAVAGGDDWLRAIRAGLDDQTLTEPDLCHEDYELATDVRELDLLAFGTAPRDRARVLQELRDGKDEVRRAAYRVLTKAIDGQVVEPDQAYVAAAALNPRVADVLRGRLNKSDSRQAILRWADRTPDPAADRLRALAGVGDVPHREAAG